MIIRQLVTFIGIIAMCCYSAFAKTIDVNLYMKNLIDLPSKSLAISSLLTVIYPKTGITVRYEIDEMQSSWQKRSKVTYRAEHSNSAHLAESGTFIADESQVLRLTQLANAGRIVCNQVDRMTANELFNMNTLDGYFRHMHLLGAARFLSLLGEDLQLVKLISTDGLQKPSMGPMRPIKEPVSFTYRYNEHTIIVHYSSDPGYNLAHGVPLELVVSLGNFDNHDMMFFYDFRKVNQLDATGLNLGDGSLASKQLLGKSTNGPLMDLFAIDRAVGCSRSSSIGLQEDRTTSDNIEGWQSSPLKGLGRTRYRFSFEAKPNLQGTESKRTTLSVVYEPSIVTLSVARTNELHRATTTTNYLTGLTYHVLDKRAHNANIQKIVASMSDDDNDNKTEGKPAGEQVANWSCVVIRATTTKTSAPNGGEGGGTSGTSGGLAGSSENPYSLGEMLLGIKQDKLPQVRYLGLAQVRGIDARAYELWNSTWPVWFQAPLVYHESKNWLGVSDQGKYRPSAGGFGASNEPSEENSRRTIWNTVIYLSGIAGVEGKQVDLTDGNLLHIDMYELETPTLRVRQRATFAIYDFAWHLTGAGHTAPGGLMRREDFLSLGDTCISSADNQYGQLDMVLTLPNGTMNEMTAWLQVGTNRNLALMQAAQRQMALPASAIYDIESRLQATANGPDGQNSISVSMRTGERVRAINQLIYLGRGNFKSSLTGELRKNLAHTLVYQFQACYLMVAHRRMDTVFAYMPTTGRCYVYTARVVGTVKQTVSALFDMLEWGKRAESPTRGTLEVYRVRHDSTPRDEDAASKSTLARVESQLGLLSFLDLSHDLSINYDRIGNELVTKSKLTSFQVSELEAKIAAPTPRETKPAEEGQTSVPEAKFGMNKFEGLGLVASDETSSVLIEPEQVIAAGGSGGGGDNNDQQQQQQQQQQWSKIVQAANGLTFGQCQTQCLIDLECNSFSWCVREGQTECVLSKVNFRQATLASQLIELQSLKRNAKFGQIFTLSINNNNTDHKLVVVQIRKHPNCELHNKNFMPLFKLSEPPGVRLDLAEMKLYPVGHRDECAQLCLERTLEVLKSDVGPSKEASLSALMDLMSETSEKSLKKLFQQHKESHARICISFSYYDRANMLTLGDVKMNRLARRIVTSETSTSSGLSSTTVNGSDGSGYCLLGDLQTEAKRKQMEREEATLSERAMQRNPTPTDNEGERVVLSDARILVTLEQFVFDFRFMFDKLHGVWLRRSPIDDAELELALAAAVRSQDAHINAHEFELLGEFVKRGDNAVHWMSTVLVNGGIAICARLCFLQLVPLWPGCKSFAYVEHDALLSNQKITLCSFNTVSLRETLIRERYDLVGDADAESRKREGANETGYETTQAIYWHYEPKPSFVSGSLDWARAIETAAGERLDSGAYDSVSAGVQMGSFALFLCSLAGISIGAYLGYRIGEQTIRSSRSIASRDTDNLVYSIHSAEMEAPSENGVEPTASIEFSDLVAMEPEVATAAT